VSSHTRSYGTALGGIFICEMYYHKTVELTVKQGVGKTTSLLSATFRCLFIAIERKNSGK